MKRYLISEASAMTGLEAHVLRYWEEELGLLIPRNELGHRYYTEEHLNILARAKEMKGKGYQLKAIKSELFGEIHSEDVDNLQPPVPVHTDVVPSVKQYRLPSSVSLLNTSRSTSVSPSAFCRAPSDAN